LSRSAARAPQVATVAETSEPVVEPVARVVPVRAEPKPEPVKPAPVRQGVKPAPGKKPSFAELFEDFGKASTAPTPASGAVDIRKIQPAHTAAAPVARRFRRRSPR
jgi:hypothetical protein